MKNSAMLQPQLPEEVMNLLVEKGERASARLTSQFGQLTRSNSERLARFVDLVRVWDGRGTEETNARLREAYTLGFNEGFRHSLGTGNREAIISRLFGMLVLMTSEKEGEANTEATRFYMSSYRECMGGRAGFASFHTSLCSNQLYQRLPWDIQLLMEHVARGVRADLQALYATTTSGSI